MLCPCCGAACESGSVRLGLEHLGPASPGSQVVAAFFLPSDGAGDADRLELTNVEGRSAARCTSCGAVVITGDVLPGAFWRCPSCRELVSAELEECWNCGSKDTPSEP